MERKQPEKNVSTHVKLKLEAKQARMGSSITVDAGGCAVHGVTWTRPPALTHEVTGAPPSGVTIKVQTLPGVPWGRGTKSTQLTALVYGDRGQSSGMGGWMVVPREHSRGLMMFYVPTGVMVLWEHTYL